MKRLIIIALLFVTATAYAAGQQYYNYPNAGPIKNNDRILIYQNASGSRNLTGRQLHRDISPRSMSNYSTGKKVMYIRNSDGAVVIGPWPY